jgi:hypothetical protein
MSTIPTIYDDHFRGHRNLNSGQRKNTESTLDEFLSAAKVDIIAIENVAVQTQGSPAVVQLIQAGQPTATNTLDVGADTYEADGSGSNINFVIGGTAEATMDNLLAASVASGTENLYWDKLSATTLRLRSADAPQGTVIGGSPAIDLDASSITNYSFDVGDVSMATLGGKAASSVSTVSTKITITTAMVTTGTIRIACPFTPTTYQVTAVSSAGALKIAMTDTFVITGDDIVITLNGGGSDLANTDVLHLNISS